MRTNIKYNLIILFLIIIGTLIVPFGCFSELITTEGEYCHVIIGDLNKKSIKEGRETARRLSIGNSLQKAIHNKKLNISDVVKWIERGYLEEIKIIDHNENKRKICEKVQVTFDPEVIKKILKKILILENGHVFFDDRNWTVENDYCDDILDLLSKKKGNVYVGIIIDIREENKSPNDRKEEEDRLEARLFECLSESKSFIKIIDRKHLNVIIDELKLSVSGLTDKDALRIGKILKLHVVVHLTEYRDSRTIKILDVNTSEIEFLRTY